MARPVVNIKAAVAPVRGHGLGSTMWKACAWCAIKCFLVGRGLVVEQIHMLELLLQQFQG